MTLLDSLLDAIVRLDGDALVMHVGEKPYVVTTSSAMSAYRGPLAWGQVELSSRVLTPDAVMSMVAQILPPDERHALEDLGAVEHPIASPAGVSDRFTVVAARGGDDIWLELRRHTAAPQVPVEVGQQASEAAAASTAAASGPVTTSAVGLQEPPLPAGIDASEPSRDGTVDLSAPDEDEHVPSDAEEAVLTFEVTTIEERVAVLDEVALHEPEHVEHIVIPVTTPGEPAAFAEREDASLEIVEPEAQHAPTEEDVDAMLAATAATLLTATGHEAADEPEAGAVPTDEPPAEDTLEMFQVVGEIEEVQLTEQTVSSHEDLVDLTAALDEIPPAAWAPPAGARGTDEVRPPEPAPAEAAASEDEAPSAAGAPALDASRIEPAVEEPFEIAAAVEPEPLESPLEASQEVSSFIPSEIPVDKSVAMPAMPEHHVSPKIAASASDRAAGGLAVPIDRAPARPERPDAGGRVDDESLLQVLRVAAERGASTVYVVARTRAMIRVDGEISAIEDQPEMSAADIERLIAALAPPRQAGAGPEAGGEWISEVPQIGRVRCVTFRDHRGPGLIFRMISPRSISAEHLNLSPEIRELCTLSDGLVLVTGARGSGKTTLMTSFVDLVNRTRSDHVITLEPEIGFVHESRRSFVSQREVHDPAGAVAAVLSAIREDPDVLVVEDVQSPEVLTAVLEAASSGRLVFASITAPSASSAVDALVNLAPAAERSAVRAMIAGVLRGVVAQVLLRKAAGGRVAARELLLNSPAVSASIQQGQASGLAEALEAGQRHGMVPLNDSLSALVRGGTVHAAEACRRAPDRTSLLAALARAGVDTSFAERLA